MNHKMLQVLTNIDYSSVMNTSGSKYCYIDFEIDGKKGNLVVFELFSKICPETSKNFLALCCGFVNNRKEQVSYQYTKINRIVKDGYIQGGDLIPRGIGRYFKFQPF